MTERLAELPFIGDQVVCLSHEPGRPQRNAIGEDPDLAIRVVAAEVSSQ
jgi:hypothetical protein